MNVLAIVSSKGGSAKTTTAVSIAVEAVRRGERVALINTDPQDTIESWHARRGSPDNPSLVEARGSLAKRIDDLEDDGYTLVIIDTPPSHVKTMAASVAVADLCIIPLQPSVFDIEAAELMAEICDEASKPFVFLVSMAPPRGTAADQAKDVLGALGDVLKSCVTQRVAHKNAVLLGKSGAELDDAVQDEIAALWREVSTHLPKERV